MESRKFLLVGLLLASQALAQRGAPQVSVASFPPNAEIRDALGQHLGVSGDGAGQPGQTFAMVTDPMRVNWTGCGEPQSPSRSGSIGSAETS